MLRRMGVLITLVMIAGCSSSPPTPTASDNVGSPSSSAKASADISPSAEAATTPPAEPTIQPTPTPPTATNARFSLLPADPPSRNLPSITCDGDIGQTDQVAIVELRSKSGLGPVVLRDYADPAHPATVCAFGKDGSYLWRYSLLDARHVLAYSQPCYRALRAECVHAVVDIPEVRYHWFGIPDTKDDTEDLVGVSPNLDEVVWRSATYSDDPNDLRSLFVTHRDGDKVVGQFPATQGGWCGPSHFIGDYAASGAYFYVLDSEAPGAIILQIYHGRQKVFSLRTKRHTIGAQAPIWSPITDALYYMRRGDEWRWTPDDGAKGFMSGTAWISPTISPDGRYVAYLAFVGDESRTYLKDLTSPAEPRLIARDRTAPHFLTDTQLWLPEASSLGCVAPGGQPPAIYDINEEAESASIIADVLSTWPAQ